MSALIQSTQVIRFLNTFFICLAVHLTMVKGLAIGKTCRANVPVHNAFCLMSFGLVACVLVEINAWDRSGCFVTKFFRILICS